MIWRAIIAVLSASSVNVAVSAVRFLYAVTLGRVTVDWMASVPYMKRSTRRRREDGVLAQKISLLF